MERNRIMSLIRLKIEPQIIESIVFAGFFYSSKLKKLRCFNCGHTLELNSLNCLNDSHTNICQFNQGFNCGNVRLDEEIGIHQRWQRIKGINVNCFNFDCDNNLMLKKKLRKTCIYGL